MRPLNPCCCGTTTEKSWQLTRSSSVGAGLAARARIVLLAAEGTPPVEIARLVGVSRPRR